MTLFKNVKVYEVALRRQIRFIIFVPLEPSPADIEEAPDHFSVRESYRLN